MDAIKRWRLEHPKATLSEIEQALEAQLGNLRARMIEGLAWGCPEICVNDLG